MLNEKSFIANSCRGGAGRRRCRGAGNFTTKHIAQPADESERAAKHNHSGSDSAQYYRAEQHEFDCIADAGAVADSGSSGPADVDQ